MIEIREIERKIAVQMLGIAEAHIKKLNEQLRAIGDKEATLGEPDCATRLLAAQAAQEAYETASAALNAFAETVSQLEMAAQILWQDYITHCDV